MHIVYANEEAPASYNKSVFLVGPTPRDKDVGSWRPAIIQLFERLGYDGVIFTPEPRNGWHHDYLDQVEWERKHLTLADRILCWVPREMKTMPALTTNIEMGTWIDSGKILYGRPDDSPKNRYLDWLVKDRGGAVFNSVEELVRSTLDILGSGSVRSGGERYVPLHIWNSKQFQAWYSNLKAVGNRLDEAKVLHQHVIGKTFLFSFVLWVKVWIESEKRHKENEFIFSRTDISTILPYQICGNDLLDTKIVLIREFRSPNRTTDGFVHELPGGSSFKDNDSILVTASKELFEETGLQVPAERFRKLEGRQMVSTLSTHRGYLFAVKLTDEEMKQAESLEQKSEFLGVEEDSERTYVEVKTLRDIALTTDLDWSMIGMIYQGLHTVAGDV